METQQTFIQQVEPGILLTESCTDGEAVVAAETDEFYQNGPSYQECKDEVRGTEKKITETSSGNEELPVDTIETSHMPESEILDTVQTGQSGTDNEDLILENV